MGDLGSSEVRLLIESLASCKPVVAAAGLQLGKVISSDVTACQ